MIRVTDQIFGRARRFRDSARQVQSAASRPTPPVKIDTGRALPGWAPRLVLIALLAAAIITLDPPIVGRVMLIIFAAVVAVRPNAASAAVFVGMMALFWTIVPTPALSALGFILLALLGALWTLAGVLGGAGLRARVELAVLARPALRFLIIQLVAQAFLLVGQLIQARDGNAMLLGSVVLAAAVILAVAIWVIMPRLTAE